MQTKSPDLLPIFRSRGLARLLLELFVIRDDWTSMSALSRATGLSISTVHREVDRLAEAGLVVETRAGNIRMATANHEAPYFTDLQSLLMKALGPAQVLADELAEVAGIEEAFVHGSWAARYLGEPGPPPADIDVIVVGRPSVREVDRACERAEKRLGREVAPTIVGPTTWNTSEAGFIRTVRARPLVPIALGDAG